MNKLRKINDEALRSQQSIDRISSLPKDILLWNVISVLPLRDATRTTVLSKRWRDLFHFVPHLVFDRNLLMNRNWVTGKWWKAIGNVLRSRYERKCILLPCCDIKAHSQRNLLDGKNLMKYLFENFSVQKFSFSMCMLYSDIPEAMYNCESLVELRLSSCTIQLPDNFNGLPNLKLLQLRDVKLTKTHVENLVSRCNRLEQVALSFCFQDQEGINFNFCSKSLVWFEFEEAFGGWTISFKDVPRLRRVYFGLNTTHIIHQPNNNVTTGRYKDKLVPLLTQLAHVKCISFAIAVTQHEFDTFQAIPTITLPRFVLFVNLKKLVLDLDLRMASGRSFLSCLLHSSPNLEELDVKSGCYDKISILPSFTTLDCWEDDKVATCVIDKLRFVRVWCSHGSKQCLEFAKFLLKNAKVLEKMRFVYKKNLHHDIMNYKLLRRLVKSYHNLEVKKFPGKTSFLTDAYA